MDDQYVEYLQDLYQKSDVLLSKVREEQWESVVDLAEEYILQIQRLYEMLSHHIPMDDKNHVLAYIVKIKNNIDEIALRLKGRLDLLKIGMSELHFANKCSQLYSNEFLSIKTIIH